MFKGDELKRVIVALHNEGKTEREIAYYHLGCSKTYVHSIIERYKNFSGHKEKMRKRKENRDKAINRERKKARSKRESFFDGYFDKWR